MDNYKNRHEKWIKTIATVVACLFLANNISFAGHLNYSISANKETLAVQVLKNRILDKVEGIDENNIDQIVAELQYIVTMALWGQSKKGFEHYTSRLKINADMLQQAKTAGIHNIVHLKSNPEIDSVGNLTLSVKIKTRSGKIQIYKFKFDNEGKFIAHDRDNTQSELLANTGEIPQSAIITINLWHNKRVQIMERDLMENGLKNFIYLPHKSIPRFIRQEIRFSIRGVLHHKQTGLQIIEKNVKNIETIREFLKTKNALCCPTFIVEEDVDRDGNSKDCVYELNLMQFGHEDIDDDYYKDLDESEKIKLRELVSRTLAGNGSRYIHNDLHFGNILVNRSNGQLADIKMIDWKKINKTNLLPNPDLATNDALSVFEARDLRDHTFKGKSFFNANFSWSNLSGVSFEGCRLFYRYLRESTFTGADLRNANFRNAQLYPTLGGLDTLSTICRAILNNTKFDKHLGSFFMKNGFKVQFKDNYCLVSNKNNTKWREKSGTILVGNQSLFSNDSEKGVAKALSPQEEKNLTLTTKNEVSLLRLVANSNALEERPLNMPIDIGPIVTDDYDDERLVASLTLHLQTIAHIIALHNNLGFDIRYQLVDTSGKNRTGIAQKVIEEQIKYLVGVDNAALLDRIRHLHKDDERIIEVPILSKSALEKYREINNNTFPWAIQDTGYGIPDYIAAQAMALTMAAASIKIEHETPEEWKKRVEEIYFQRWQKVAKSRLPNEIVNVKILIDMIENADIRLMNVIALALPPMAPLPISKCFEIIHDILKYA